MIAFFETLTDAWLTWVLAASWQLALLVAVVAIAAWLARRASPRVRYALWLLILVKVFLPPSLVLKWSVGNWALRPLWNTVQPTVEPYWNVEASSQANEGFAEVTTSDSPVSETSLPAIDASSRSRMAGALFVVWLTGCLLFYLLVAQRYLKLNRSINQMQLVDEGPLRIRLEKIALELGIRRLPELYLSQEATSPFLCGFKRPSIILPRQLVDELSPADINSVLLHELNHWRRRDPWVGWLQVVAQGLFWFHPFVWLANTRLRHERECACDEAVLQSGNCEPTRYGEALLAVLGAARGRSPVHGSLVGIFEPGANIQKRLEEIMQFQPKKQPFGGLSYLALAIFACLVLPMALPTASAKTDEVITIEGKEGNKDLDRQQVRKWPWIAKTVPAVGAIDVDPKLTEISVTFDRDMQKGMSWTGNKKYHMPPLSAGAKARWRDSRTCVLPVKLEKGKYYRVGINSTSFLNFKSVDGTPAPSAVVYFATEGAPRSVQRRVRVPKLEKLIPENGAADVSPTATTLRATFDMPMSGDMSWTGGGTSFPKIDPDKKTKWTGGGKTCVLPVQLQPSHEYQLGLNSYSHINFQSKWGVPIEPVVYQFKTSGAAR